MPIFYPPTKGLIGCVMPVRCCTRSPDGLLNMREPLQAGAEMYGFADIRGDIELIDLMLKSMKIADMGKVLLSLGHIGIFRALSDAAHLDAGSPQRCLP